MKKRDRIAKKRAKMFQRKLRKDRTLHAQYLLGKICDHIRGTAAYHRVVSRMMAEYVLYGKAEITATQIRVMFEEEGAK